MLFDHRRGKNGYMGVPFDQCFGSTNRLDAQQSLANRTARGGRGIIYNIRRRGAAAGLSPLLYRFSCATLQVCLCRSWVSYRSRVTVYYNYIITFCLLRKDEGDSLERTIIMLIASWSSYTYELGPAWLDSIITDSTAPSLFRMKWYFLLSQDYSNVLQ